MAKAVLELLPPALLGKVEIGQVRYDRELNSIAFDSDLDESIPKSSPVLVLDSSVYSGKSMLGVIEGLQQRGIKNVISYSLVLKRGSVFVPTFFGVLINEKDRIFLPNNVLPNNRLNEAPPFGVLREVRNSDVHRKIGKVGAPFDTTTIGDLLYEKEAKNLHAYVYQCGDKIAAFVSFAKQGETVFLDTLATVKSFRGRHIGSALLRWVETWARSSLCDRIQLWAFENAIPVYQKYGYEFVDTNVRDLGGQNYRIMTKRILYHVRMDHSQAD